MSLFDIIPERPVSTAPLAVDQDADIEPRKRPGRPKAGSSPARDAGIALGAALGKIVSTPEKRIAKNNRLALMMEIHSNRQANKKQPKEGRDMPSRSTKGTCDSCGDKHVYVTNSHGEQHCSTCRGIWAGVNNRLHSVTSAIKSLGLEQKTLELLGVNEAAAVVVEGELLTRLAAMVGYAGTSGDELFAEIEKAVSKSDQAGQADEIERLKGELERAISKSERLAAENTALAGRIQDLELQQAEPSPEPLPVIPPTTPACQAIDSKLLDIAIGVMRGDVVGINVDTIESLRYGRAA